MTLFNRHCFWILLRSFKNHSKAISVKCCKESTTLKPIFNIYWMTLYCWTENTDFVQKAVITFFWKSRSPFQDLWFIGTVQPWLLRLPSFYQYNQTAYEHTIEMHKYLFVKKVQTKSLDASFCFSKRTPLSAMVMQIHTFKNKSYSWSVAALLLTKCSLLTFPISTDIPKTQIKMNFNEWLN